MPLLEISVVPVGTESESFNSDVEKAVSVIEQNGLNYQVTPTSTIIEGELDKLMDVAQVIHLNEIENQAKRVVTTIKIDDRVDKPISLDRQVDRVSNSDK
ncbi:MTH1187 family thiamine-binding protein [Salipaludibacillus sp. CUR1]|uniref:Uncharacterized protein, MTH1187 family n=1 Tax=Salipaludibacillus aurantiacus TaxID=1601833 RepID=A0A1H9TI46_9BACI|nr:MULTISPECIES: MTH1187 family thiamine-binding protein [Salipaludibacillus]MCE7794797.1 MTH1187 family thiamine-binding protein [Salipaludibacillus sp. CUR1]SER96293.1 uncharacterized protein, MTH1187 family [Salipaludibacillus aurantiacus]